VAYGATWPGAARPSTTILQVPNRISETITTWLLVACALTVTGLLVRREFSRRPASGPQPSKVAKWQSFQAGGKARGLAGAPVTMTVFTDFQCPACAVLEQRIKVLDSARPGQLRFVYRNWPLPIHQKARPAAFAAECADRQGRYWQAHDALFAARDSVSVRSWGSFANSLAIQDTAAFARCVRDSLEVASVRRDEAAVKQLGTGGTPTILLNQFLFDGVPSVDTLLAYVDRERRAAQ
jgi:protein-disulfide isomerase